MRRNLTKEPYIVAARVTGKLSEDDELYLSATDTKAGDTQQSADATSASDGEATSADANNASTETDKPKTDDADPLAGKEPEKTDINAVLVADIDWIAPIIFHDPRARPGSRLRRRLEIPECHLRA